MDAHPIIGIKPLGFQWDTADPFLFCVHHEDFYPAGNDKFGPAASLQGRDIGQDFTIKDGWRMYHGSHVPGFPAHPHRGFETVTIVRQGLVDHADSLGAAGRYGGGDVQWMTAGQGIQHAEMFPLLDQQGENTLELLQIWLNLPRTHKLVKPHFTMLWREEVPTHVATDDAGKSVEVTVIAGQLAQAHAPSPPPNSWAADPANRLAIWTLTMDAGARWTLPPDQRGINRTLYFFKGSSLQVEGTDVSPYHAVQLHADQGVSLHNGAAEGSLLMLQGRPIGESVAQHGPFVMNTPAEIQQAFLDYQSTQFGGWPWPSSAPIHGRHKGRFAKHADGKEEMRGG